MTTFADDPDLHVYLFLAGWGPRAETAIQIAARVQGLVRLLGEIEPEWSEIWPILAARAIRPEEPHVLQLSTDDLGMLIDRRARFDPPRWPAPVGPDGYQIVFGANRIGIDPMKFEMSVHAGSTEAETYIGNGLLLSPHDDGPIWRDEARGRAVVEAIIDCFEPDWVNAGATGGAPLGNTGPRAWLNWAAPGCVPPEHFRPPSPGVVVDTLSGGALQYWE